MSLGLVALALLPLGAARGQSTTTTTTEAPVTLECEAVPSQNDLSIEYCRPGDATSNDPTFPLRIEVTNTGGNSNIRDYLVTAISVEVVPTQPEQQLPTPADKTWEGPAARRAVLEWEPAFPTNGTYDLRIIAEGDAPGGQTATAAVPMRLAAPPHPPTGVKVAKSDDGSILVSWSNTDREPDVISYEVSRSGEGATTSQVVGTVESSEVPRLVDDPGTGSWRYAVTALRRGATSSDEDRISSTPSTDDIEVTAASTSSGADGPASVAGTTASSDSAPSSSATSSTQPRATTASRGGVAPGTVTPRPGGRTSTTTRRTERDPGFKKTLPFDVPTEQPEPLPDQEVAPPERTAEDEVAGQELLSDDAGERRRSLGFVAGGLLLFVLGLTGLFLKAEVQRMDELESLDPQVPPDPALAQDVAAAPPAVVAVAAPVAAVAPIVTELSHVPRRRAAAPVAPASDAAPAAPVHGRSRAEARAQRAVELSTLFRDERSTDVDDERHLADLADALQPAETRANPGRVRRTVAPADAPDLDVPDPPAATPATTTATPARRSPTTTTRTRTTDRARRAPTRLPSRPADDRRQGGAAVRPGRRGTGQGDRRLPVG